MGSFRFTPVKPLERPIRPTSKRLSYFAHSIGESEEDIVLGRLDMEDMGYVGMRFFIDRSVSRKVGGEIGFCACIGPWSSSGLERRGGSTSFGSGDGTITVEYRYPGRGSR